MDMTLIDGRPRRHVDTNLVGHESAVQLQRLRDIGWITLGFADVGHFEIGQATDPERHAELLLELEQRGWDMPRAPGVPGHSNPDLAFQVSDPELGQVAEIYDVLLPDPSRSFTEALALPRGNARNSVRDAMHLQCAMRYHCAFVSSDDGILKRRGELHEHLGLTVESIGEATERCLADIRVLRARANRDHHPWAAQLPPWPREDEVYRPGG